MPDPTSLLHFKVLRCGEVALLTLRADAPCRVAAVFERSFYLQSGGAMACLGNPAIGLGPLNGILDVPPGINWQASGLRAGDRCRRSAGTIHLGARFRLDLTGAMPWRPQAWPETPEPISVARALNRLSRACAERVPMEGLAPLLAPGITETNRAMLAATQEALTGCRQWLSNLFGAAACDDCSAFEWTRDLIGLGPGLTPSGDDFLGGLMIALHALARPEAARGLAACVARAGAAGNPISAVHLAAAGDGLGHEALHMAINDFLDGADSGLDAHLDALDRIGHSSGWDTFAGVVAVLRAWLAAQGTNRRAA